MPGYSNASPPNQNSNDTRTNSTGARKKPGLSSDLKRIDPTVEPNAGISQNYIPAIEANARQVGPKLQDALVKYFGCDLDTSFRSS